MSPLSLSLVLFFFLFFSNFPISHSSNFNTPSLLIFKTCQTISDQDPNISFNFCLTSLQLGRHAAATDDDVDLRRLGLLSIRLTRRNVSSTRRHIKKYLRRNEKGLDAFVESCLVDCLELYSDAVPTLGQARRDYKAGRYSEASAKISSVMDDGSTCEDGFKEEGRVISPLSMRNYNTFELSAIALSIINIMLD